MNNSSSINNLKENETPLTSRFFSNIIKQKSIIYIIFTKNSFWVWSCLQGKPELAARLS